MCGRVSVRRRCCWFEVFFCLFFVSLLVDFSFYHENGLVGTAFISLPSPKQCTNSGGEGLGTKES